MCFTVLLGNKDQFTVAHFRFFEMRFFLRQVLADIGYAVLDPRVRYVQA